ncbi:MAG: peptidoglycan editing factor PgeF, partial [Clostridiales bacterium]|nr:peptidoglycan editing factor PgeF [Clostridiales bacterium]
MIVKDKSGFPLCVFPSFEKAGVSHGISTRLGGVSEGHLATLNLGYSRGDEKEKVTENFNRFCSACGVKLEDTVFSAQVHKTDLLQATSALKRDEPGPSQLNCVDGLHTNEPGVALVTFFADCVPLLFYDPVEKVVAASHAGWRGTAAMIGMKTVETMQEVYGSKPENILAGIGPSIGPCCFEVDEPVVDAFLESVPDCEPFISALYKNEKRKIDLWGCNKHILLLAGLKGKNIDCAPLCTCCHSGLFYSHRRDGDKRGSLAAL